MRNWEVERILNNIAIFLEMDDVPFKPRAYEKAARSIEALEEDVEEIYTRGGIKALEDIPSVGKGIAEKIEELIKTGKLEYYENLKKKVPVDIDSLSAIEGLGPKKIKILWQELGIRNIDDLEKACLSHKVCKIAGFQEKTEENLLSGIQFTKKSKGRFILGFVLGSIREIENRLRNQDMNARVAVAGSVRRMKETIGDVDFLVASEKPAEIMHFFTTMPEVAEVIAKGDTKSSIKLNTGMNADLRVVPVTSFGAALQYFTGNKDHNIAIRKIAQSKKLKLSEYGLFRGNRAVAGKEEDEIYEKLGLKWIPPELRENSGEIEAASEDKLPKLIEYNDLKGDLQVHSTWTDGSNSIKEMAEAAKNYGLEYIVISDHSRSLAMTGGLDENGLAMQGKEIDQLNRSLGEFRILKGVELNIMKDGTVDIDAKALEKLDVVGAAVHSYFNLSREEMTQRVVRAIENPNIDILYHPTARQLQKREPIELDIEKVMQSAKDHGTILDIDSFPDRLDLKDELIRKAINIGVKLDISSDSHSKNNLHYLELGIAQARRGWATRQKIINTQKLEDFLISLKSPA
ncbi:MAG TPA: DNA polymerase/3'-5' exonuclease PolX [Nitrososphaerales archaeon]|nr:DNA polymerase/3'-5' exonuclease PolX [Nitrososphaerales archaeon]